jgi:arginase
MRTTASLALDGVENGDGPILVHLDVDLLDPTEMAAKDPLLPGPGLTWAEASDLLTALLASPRVVALQIAEFNPSLDPDGTAARRLVGVIARAVLRHLRG